MNIPLEWDINSSSPEIAQALTQAVSAAIVAACPPKADAASSSTSSSPAKIIENRSRCYKQLGEIQNLKLQGLLSEDDYIREKNAILLLLKKLI